jgi:ubiquitin C-terminal hydrolase
MNTKNNNYFIPPVGLLNLSIKGKANKRNKNSYNTCYINSSVQCLFRLEEFKNFILKSSKGKLSEETRKLILDMINNKDCKNNILSMSKIKECLAEFNEKYSDNNPKDANEFITDYLNALHKENAIKDDIIKNEIAKCKDENYSNFLKKCYKKGSSFISNLFYGILRTKNYCKKCNSIFSIKYHSFIIFDLPLYYLSINNENEPLDIEDIIENYIQEKELSNSYCTKCKLKVYTKTDIYKFPKYLIIYLERQVENYYFKNDINIKTMDLTNFLKEKSEKTIFNIKGVIYYSVLSNNNGHYASQNLIGNQWYYFDDHEFQRNEKYSEYEGDNPILFFYEKNI